MNNYDFLIVGGGVVGLTASLEIRKRRPQARIAVLEKEDRPGLHASGRNSGVLHCGIYYGSTTMKAKLSARGSEMMRAFASEHSIPCNKSGKVIVAQREEDLPGIDRLLANASASGIRAEKLDEQAVRKIEPHAAPHGAGIHCPDTAVIDAKAVMAKLTDIAREKGIEVACGEEVNGIDPAVKSVRTARNEYGYGVLLNCAGAYADKIARFFGAGGDYVLVPFKGLYWRLRPEAERLVQANIYPVPDLGMPFLGVHLTRVVDGHVYAGPTAIPAFGRENYGLLSGIRPGEAVSIGWRLVRMYLDGRGGFRALVAAEMRKYMKSGFVAAARRLVPDIAPEDLVPATKVGIRPQLVNIRTGELQMDYVIERVGDSIHVLNAISPAFTCSLAFAELLIDQLEGKETPR